MIRDTLARIGADLVRRARTRRHIALASPPGQWTLWREGSRVAPTRTWVGYGTEIRIEPQGLGEPWTVRDTARDAVVYEGHDPFAFTTEYCRDVMRAETGGRKGVGRAD